MGGSPGGWRVAPTEGRAGGGVARETVEPHGEALAGISRALGALRHGVE